MIIDVTAALAYLDAHVNFEKAPARLRSPTLDRMRALCALMGDPQTAYPVVHITGTNGKGSTARMVSTLLGAHGLTVGTYTSPHLERLTERVAVGGTPISDDELVAALFDMQAYESHLGVELTHFEVLTALALAHFADVAVDVAVLEVGLGGRWDATNVADGVVAVVTNVGVDHAEVIGPTRHEIATEKAGIIKPGATLVLGETDPTLAPIFRERPAGAVWERDADFGTTRNRVAIGGRALDLRTPGREYLDVFIPLRGAHQGDNAAVALAAGEAFFGRALDPDVVQGAFADVSVPGRFEVVGHHPLVVLDGAHNPDGARALARTLAEDLGGRVPDVLVVGYTSGRDPREMLGAITAGAPRRVIVCRPPHPRGLPVEDVLAAAVGLGLTAEAAPSVDAAVTRALAFAGEADFVLITGSLYVVGDARTHFHRD